MHGLAALPYPFLVAHCAALEHFIEEEPDGRLEETEAEWG